MKITLSESQTESSSKSGVQLPLILFCISVLLLILQPKPGSADTAAEIDRDVNIALQKLYDINPTARKLSTSAKGIMVFPNIIKGGLIIGGQYGIGSLKINGATYGYYQTVAASYGLQIGAQTFGYAMFIMTGNGLNYLKDSQGWEVGVGPSVAVVDEGMAKTLTTTSTQEDIYVFFFNQKGLMAGLGIQGSKISPYTPNP
ncbi:YSC84-related protein [Desulfosediminicola ganghwensis]|uniref:lipid-binding SYLF domain-containing protein n=1 Tax=Desulfosediminicola ganghwensis TaxID=2569540 RepID=UPI0010AD1CBC|nr:YSC84-related protein [Desulfosediminicola ganghwensis]